jgi:hypothetical protein
MFTLRTARISGIAAAAVVAAIAPALIPGAIATQPAGATTAASTLSKATRYTGKTSQGRRVSFKVRGGRVVRPSFLVVHRGCGAQVTFTGTDGISRRGRFSFGGSGGHYFKGKFVSRKKVRGRAAIKVSDTACRGGGVHAVSYTARRDR